MPRETFKDVKAERDALSKQLHVAMEVTRVLARRELPDAEDQCAMENGTIYRFSVFGVNRSHGGVILISFQTPGNQKGDPISFREQFESQYFEDAARIARSTATAVPEAYPYRDAFDRLSLAVRKLQQEAA